MTRFLGLREAYLTVSFDECHFCKRSMKYLGYVVDRQGLHVDQDKVKTMIKLPPPKTVKEVRRVIGTFSWYRRIVPDFSTIVSPITALVNKSSRFNWSAESDAAFRKIREFLI